MLASTGQYAQSEAHGKTRGSGPFGNGFQQVSERAESSRNGQWYALYTLPQNEFMVARKLAMLEIESFLPTFEVTHVWKNRRRMKIAKPLFPTYVFVRAERELRGRILSTTGAIRMVGSQSGPCVIPDAEIDFLRAGLSGNRLEPYHDLVPGKTVRIRRGPMEGVEGVLVRKANGLRFVLTVQAIQQSVALEVAAEDLEPVAQPRSGVSFIKHHI